MYSAHVTIQKTLHVLHPEAIAQYLTLLTRLHLIRTEVSQVVGTTWICLVSTTPVRGDYETNNSTEVGNGGMTDDEVSVEAMY